MNSPSPAKHTSVRKDSRVTTKKRVQFEETGMGSMDLPEDVGFDDDEGPPWCDNTKGLE